MTTVVAAEDRARSQTAAAGNWPVWRGLVLQWIVMAAVFAAYHRALMEWMRATGQTLGAISERMVVPLYAVSHRAPPGLRLVPALVATAVLFASVPLLLDPRRRPARFVALGMGLFVALGLSVASIDGVRQHRGLQAPPFAGPLLHWGSDPFGDVPHVERLGVRSFLERYGTARFFARLTTHSKTTPRDRRCSTGR